MDNNKLITVEETRDFYTLKNIIHHPAIKYGLLEGKENINDDLNLDNDDIIYYLFRCEGNICGFCAFLDVDDNCYWCDVAILPDYRGKIGILAGKLAIEVFNKNKGFEKLITRVKKENRRSLFYAFMCGFRKICSNNDFYYLEVNYGRSS